MNSLGRKTGQWCALLTAMVGLLVPGLLRAVDDPTDAGIDRKPLAIGLATAAASAAGTTIAGTAFACKEQQDGKIVVVGNTQRTLLVMRFNVNGAPDTTFGDNGMFLLTGVDIWYEGGAGLDLQSDGSIVIATRTYTAAADSAILVRLTPAGQLDMTFSGSGVKSLNTPDRAYSKRVFVLPDGKILAGGNYPSGIWVARCLANGDADTSFGTNGKSYIQQSTQNNFNGQIGQLLPLPDGKMLILSLGIISDTREAWVVNRLTATGAMDPTFMRISLPYDGTNTYIGAMARLNDGRIAVTIPRFDVSYPIGDMVALYSEDGVPQSVISDTTFAGSRGTAKWDMPNSLVVRTDGSLCGLLGTRLVQFLPTLQVLSTESSASGLQESRLYPLADGGLLKSGSLVRRYAPNGSPVLTYTVATSTNFAYPPDISVEESFFPIPDGGSRTFASAVVNGVPSTLTFTIRNTGFGDLNDLAISLSGTHAGDFSFSALGATTVAGGGGRSFTVSFAPKGIGTRTAKLQIASNDADETPFDITLTGQGTGSAPEIVVESPTSITDGGSLTLNSVNVGAPALTRSFTIRNTGSANLTGLAISFTGTHAADFSATALTSSTIVPGGSQSFKVSFAPKAAGSRTAKLLIASNDADENPFDITFNGQGTTLLPEIEVALASPIVDGGRVDMGTRAIYAPAVTYSFSIRNHGPGPLTDLKVTITGPNAADFSAGALETETMVGPSLQTLKVSFAPKAPGARSATLQIASNDEDENPYDIILTGSAVEVPQEIVVQAPSSILTGSTLALGTHLQGSSALTRTITIRNYGWTPLTGIGVTIDGPDAADFSLSALPGDTILGNETLSFTVSFATQVQGLRTATMRIASNDTDENPFNIVLTGQGSALDIAFTGGDRLLRPVQTIDLGVMDTGASAERSFTIRNAGTVELSGLLLETIGADAAPLAIVPSLPQALAPGESFTFTIRFTARLIGSRTSMVRILSSVGEEARVNFSARVRAPRLEVRHRSGKLFTAGTSVIAWGSNSFGQAKPPNNLNNVVAVSAGEKHSVALKRDGTVVSWGDSRDKVPEGFAEIAAVAVGGGHTLALRRDGTVVASGRNFDGEIAVPAGLSGVIAIAAGHHHSVVGKQDGRVVAWGSNAFGQSTVPTGLTDVMAVATGDYHTLALKRDGTVFAWGLNSGGQSTVPAGLADVTSIAAGSHHSVALKRDGGLAAWGESAHGQCSVPVGLTDVAAVAASGYQSFALLQDGSVAAWGADYHGLTDTSGLVGVTAIAAGKNHALAIGDLVVDFAASNLGHGSNSSVSVTNAGDLPLALSRVEFEGMDAVSFRLGSLIPVTLSPGAVAQLSLRYVPARVGRLRATARIFTNDPEADSFTISLSGTASFEIDATKASVKGSALSYDPMVADRTTGLVLQKMTFANPTGVLLNGLRLILSKVAQGVIVGSSSAGSLPQTVEVIYSKPIAAGETVQFYLTYADAKRNTSASIQPFIRAEALMEPEPRTEPVLGALTPILGVRDTAQGPLIEWNCRPKAAYVVEYSDDRGVTWFSAVHRLVRNGTRISWVDRGQPETFSKPVNKASRSYRVKRL